MSSKPILLALLVLLLGWAPHAAAASPACAQADGSVTALIDRIRMGRVGREAFEELGKSGTGEAVRALEEFATELDNRQSRRFAYLALRHFLGDSKLERRVLDFMVRAANGRDGRVAFEAGGSLSQFGPRSEEARLEVAEKARTEGISALMINSLRGRLAEKPDARARSIVLGAVQVPQSGTRAQVIELLRAFVDRKDFEVMANLIGRARAPFDRKELVLAALEGHPFGVGDEVNEGVERVLAKALQQSSSALQHAALVAIARRGGTHNLKDVERATRSKDPAVRRAAILASLRAGTERLNVPELSVGRDPIGRMAAAIMLGEDVDSTDSLARLLVLLDDEEWTVRVEAIRSLTLRREVQSIEPLVVRLGVETGRLREDIAEALRTLTGRSYGRTASVWRRFWAVEGGGFVLPTLEEIAARDEEKEAQEQEQSDGRAATVADFYGVEIVSDAFALVIDTSGSMARAAYSGERRIAVAKEQILRALGRIADGARFNIVAFADLVYALDDSLLVADPGSREQAQVYIEALRARGGTNIYGALVAAFADESLDTVYLLSDGAASTGDLTDTDGIRERVRRWNSARGVRIHCIAIGQDHDLLRAIAVDSGGVYRRVD